MTDIFDFTFNIECKHCSKNYDEIAKVRAAFEKLAWDIERKNVLIRLLTKSIEDYQKDTNKESS